MLIRSIPLDTFQESELAVSAGIYKEGVCSILRVALTDFTSSQPITYDTSFNVDWLSHLIKTKHQNTPDADDLIKAELEQQENWLALVMVRSLEKNILKCKQHCKNQTQQAFNAFLNTFKGD